MYDMKQEDIFDLSADGTLHAKSSTCDFFLPEDAAKILLLRCGVFLCAEDTLYFDGCCGATRMYNVLRLLCHDIPTRICDMQVLSLRDYQTGIGFDLKKEKTYPLSPAPVQAIALDAESGSIVLVADESRCCLRIYAAAWHTARARAAYTLEQLRAFIRNWIMQRT